MSQMVKSNEEESWKIVKIEDKRKSQLVIKSSDLKEPAGLEEILLQLNATLPVVPLEIAKAKRPMIKRSSKCIVNA